MSRDPGSERNPDARPYLPELRRRAVELARRREKRVAKTAEVLGIVENCLRNWLRQSDIDEGRSEGLTTGERAELACLRREVRDQAMEIESLKRASACFVRESVRPK